MANKTTTREAPPDLDEARPSRGASTALAVPVAEKLTKAVLAMYPPPARGEQRAIKLIDLPLDMQEELIKAYAIPLDVERPLMLLLAGIPYPSKDALTDLAWKRGLVRLETEPLPTQRCVDLGCATPTTKGYRAEGTGYETWKECFQALRAKYPNAQDEQLKKKMYKDVTWTPAEDYQRAHFARCTATFTVDGETKVYSLFADACPHNCTSVTRASLARMSSTRAVSVTLRPALRLPLASAEELPGAITDAQGRVTGIHVEEVLPEAETRTLGVEFTEEQQERTEKLVAALGLNKGALDYIIGQSGSAAATITELERRLEKQQERAAATPVRSKEQLVADVATERARLGTKMPDGEWNSLCKGRLGTTVLETADAVRLAEFLAVLKGIK